MSILNYIVLRIGARLLTCYLHHLVLLIGLRLLIIDDCLLDRLDE